MGYATKLGKCVAGLATKTMRLSAGGLYQSSVSEVEDPCNLRMKLQHTIQASILVIMGSE